MNDQSGEYYDEEEEEKIKDNVSEESGLSELSNEELYFANKTIYQKKALFYKNMII